MQSKRHAPGKKPRLPNGHLERLNHLSDSLVGGINHLTHMMPWIDNNRRLISWWDMNKFGASVFMTASAMLMRAIRHVEDHQHEGLHHLNAEVPYGTFTEIAGLLESIGCHISAGGLRRVQSDLENGSVLSIVLAARLCEIGEAMQDEMKSHLFFWVPAERAKFHDQTGETLLGEECLKRFPNADLGKEAERAMRCYAFGEWTACGFHMVRIGDAGVKAFAAAIKYPKSNSSWGQIYDEFKKQRDLPRPNRPPHWAGDKEQFLESMADMLCAIKPYRDETAHFKKVYDDKEAEHMVSSIPAFMRQLASQIDEEGNWV